MSEEIIPSNLLPEMHLVPPPVAASILTVTEETLAVWRSTRRYPLKFVKVGRKVLYRMSDLQKFIEARTHSGVSSEAASTRRRRKAA